MAGLVLGDLLDKISGLLGDADPAAPFTRFPKDTLIQYIHEAETEISVVRPEALAVTVEVPLAVGDIQRLPEEYQCLRDAHDSINGKARSRVTKSDYRYARMFQPVIRSRDLDYDPVRNFQVRTFTPHPVDDALFYVEPPVPPGASVRLNATVIRRPVRLTSADTARTIAIREEFEALVTDWVLYRAYGSDHESNTAREMSKHHRAAFDNAVAVRTEARDRVWNLPVRSKQTEGQQPE